MPLPLDSDQEDRLRAILARRGGDLSPETIQALNAPAPPPGRLLSRLDVTAIPVAEPPLSGPGRLPTGGTISKREGEVLQLTADGLTNVEISRRLFLSEETVKSHIRHILDKMGARSRTHAVAIGMRLGIIS